MPCVYASTSLALAVLEALVHTDPDLLPEDLVAVQIAVADVIDEAPEEAELPARWRVEIGDSTAQAFGGAWSRQLRTPLLVLPSVLLPASLNAPERNVLINPLHPDAAAVSIVELVPFSFDSRLIQD